MVRTRDRVKMRPRLSAVITIALGPLACSEPLGNVSLNIDARPYVVGRAAANLSATGTFQFSGTEFITFPITPERAKALGVAWLQTNAFPTAVPPGGRSFGEQVEAEHGRIDWQRITAAPSVFVAYTPYQDSNDAMPAVLRSFLGSFYLITVQSRGAAVAVIGVSAYNTDHHVTASGHLAYERALPNSYAFAVTPRKAEASLPMQPERAVQIAYERTGLRVSEVPIFVRPSRYFSPELSYWRIILERSTYFERRANGVRVPSNVVFVTPEGELMLPIGEIRDSIPYRYLAADSAVLTGHYSPTLGTGMYTLFALVSPLVQ